MVPAGVHQGIEYRRSGDRREFWRRRPVRLRLVAQRRWQYHRGWRKHRGQQRHGDQWQPGRQLDASAGAVYVVHADRYDLGAAGLLKPANTFGNIRSDIRFALRPTAIRWLRAPSTKAARRGDQRPDERGRNGSGACTCSRDPRERGPSRVPQGIERGGERLAWRHRFHRDDGNTVASASLDEDCPATGVNPTQACDNEMKSDTPLARRTYLCAPGQTGPSRRSSGLEHRPGRLVRVASATQWRRQHTRRVRSARGQARAGINGKQDDDSAQEAGPSTSSPAPRNMAQKAYVQGV